MSRFDMVKASKCPLGHGNLDNENRCFKCSANWVTLKPENGRYQSVGFGNHNAKLITLFNSKDNVVMEYVPRGVE